MGGTGSRAHLGVMKSQCESDNPPWKEKTTWGRQMGYGKILKGVPSRIRTDNFTLA